MAALGEYGPLPIDPVLWRDYQLLTTFNIVPVEPPAVWLDWMLQIHATIERVRARRDSG